MYALEKVPVVAVWVEVGGSPGKENSSGGVWGRARASRVHGKVRVLEPSEQERGRGLRSSHRGQQGLKGRALKQLAFPHFVVTVRALKPQGCRKLYEDGIY